MNDLKKVLMLIVASATIGTLAAAQDTRADSEACRTEAAVGAYHRCALWFEGNKVRRGSEGTVVAGQGLFGPPHLTQLVAGDSAMRYARLFERRSKQSMALVVIGAAVMVLSATQADCSGKYSGCEYDWSFGSPAFGILLGGAALTGIGAGFQVRATRAGAKAVWWHNERFAR
jgi:hypothetical protein